VERSGQRETTAPGSERELSRLQILFALMIASNNVAIEEKDFLPLLKLNNATMGCDPHHEIMQICS
jgi:hypothetical protein